MAKESLDLRGMSDSELLDELNSMETDYQKFSFEHAVKGLANPITLRSMRKDIARIKTEIRQREMAQLTPEQVANRSKIRARRRK